MRVGMRNGEGFVAGSATALVDMVMELIARTELGRGGCTSEGEKEGEHTLGTRSRDAAFRSIFGGAVLELVRSKEGLDWVEDLAGASVGFAEERLH